MDKDILWSLRLGFSNNQSFFIKNEGISSFLEKSYSFPFDTKTPAFLENIPKTSLELKKVRNIYKNATAEEKKQKRKNENHISMEMKSWWISKITESEYPLREKMVLMLHNHYVATFKKVKVNYWIFEHNQILRKNAFGNYKTLTKEIIKSNAIVRYLDNNENKKGKINENLSRELLELFTLGIGNYTEEDIKNGAKALAGLSPGDVNAQYRKNLEDNSTITYLGKTGKFKVDNIIDIIFEQKAIPYLMTRKILQWFIYDNPSEELIAYYGDYFREVNFEFQPLLSKIFIEEFNKDTAGSKIKNPLEYGLQLLSELNLEPKNNIPIVNFLKQQSMDLFNQPNVKGWNGGKSWLTTQIYLQRNAVADAYCQGRVVNKNKLSKASKEKQINLNWQKGTNKEIIKELSNRLLFTFDEETQKDFETILKYDFDPNLPNADQAVLRLFNAMVKQPEFQLI